MNLGLAALLAYAAPRLFFGIPLIEMISSLPAMGASAIVSMGAALGWNIVAAVRGVSGYARRGQAPAAAAA